MLVDFQGSPATIGGSTRHGCDMGEVHGCTTTSLKKHHYIPVFYLKRWAGTDGRLCEFSRPYDQFSRPYDHRVKPRMTHPAGTGYEENLYSMQGFEPALAQQIEERFFKFTNSLAADALERLVTRGSRRRMAQELRSAWSRFIISLLLRTPPDIQALRAQWGHTFTDTDVEARKSTRKSERMEILQRSANTLRKCQFI
ncbi:MAG: DUF4238 domain-containing protein [Mesorhizobium sp.]|nr:MAG: DUF4238 domain-containing protein [Mesorhizobium sp.]